MGYPLPFIRGASCVHHLDVLAHPVWVLFGFGTFKKQLATYRLSSGGSYRATLVRTTGFSCRQPSAVADRLPTFWCPSHRFTLFLKQLRITCAFCCHIHIESAQIGHKHLSIMVVMAVLMYTLQQMGLRLLPAYLAIRRAAHDRLGLY